MRDLDSQLLKGGTRNARIVADQDVAQGTRAIGHGGDGQGAVGIALGAGNGVFRRDAGAWDNLDAFHARLAE